MKDFARFSLVLASICFVSAALLAAVNNSTEEIILERKFSEEKQALQELFSGAYDFASIESGARVVYVASDTQGNPLGYAFKIAAKGYSSIIEALVAVDLDGSIEEVKILSQNETPGVGTKITDLEFLNKFRGAGLNKTLAVDTISGATISSSALIGSIGEAAEEIKILVNSQIKKDER
jgi:electron transport complex protein RnfG